MNSTLPAQILKRLIYSKYLFRHGCELLERSSPLAEGMAVLCFQDAVEMMLRTVAEHVGAHIGEQDGFQSLFNKIDVATQDKGLLVPDKSMLFQLNKARNNFKHWGLMPVKSDALKFRNDLEITFTKLSSMYFASDFSSVSFADLVYLRRVHNLLVNAESFFEKEAFVQNPSTSTSGPRSDANGDSSDGSNIITGDNNQSGRVRFDQRSQQVLNQTNVGGDQLNATVGPGGMAIGKVQGDVHVYPPAPGTDFTDRASSETLKRLEELYSFREVTSGFQSQASCLSWCNKVAPLLKFNPDYYKKVIDGIDLLCFNLSSYSSGPVFQQIVNIVERAIEELKYSVPSPLRTFFCAPDFNRGQDTEDAEIGELMHHYGRRIEDTNELRILDVNHPVWEWTRTEVGRNAPRFMVIYGPYTSNFNKKGELIARYRIIGTGLHKPENKTELPLLELDILRTEEIHGCSGYPPERKLKSMNRIYVKYSDLSDGKWHEFEVPFSFDYGYLWEFRIEAFDGTHGKPDNIAHYGNSVRLFFDNISIYNAL